MSEGVSATSDLVEAQLPSFKAKNIYSKTCTHKAGTVLHAVLSCVKNHPTWARYTVSVLGLCKGPHEHRASSMHRVLTDPLQPLWVLTAWFTYLPEVRASDLEQRFVAQMPIDAKATVILGATRQILQYVMQKESPSTKKGENREEWRRGRRDSTLCGEYFVFSYQSL